MNKGIHQQFTKSEKYGRVFTLTLSLQIGN